MALLMSGCAPKPAPEPVAPPPPVVEAPQYPSEPLPNLRPPQNMRPSYMGGVQPVRVALLLPLKQKGERNGLAQSMLSAAEMALFDFGAQNVLLLPKDTKGTEEGARIATEQALREGADLILGPLYAEEVRSAGTLARGNGVSMIGFSTDRTVAGGGVYLLSFLPESEVTRVTSFAAQRGMRSFAMLAPRTAYGDRVLAAFGQSLTQMGFAPPQLGEVAPPSNQGQGLVALERYAGVGGMIVDPTLRLAERGGFDALFIPEGGVLLKESAMAIENSVMGVGRVKLLGTGLWDDPSLGSQKALVGGWFAAPSPQKRAGFIDRYKAAYGGPPARLASLSYDAVSLAISLSRGAESNGTGGLRNTAFGAQALLDPRGFDGVDGIFRFREDGTAERGLAVLEVRPSGAVVIDQAPLNFDVLY